MSLQLYQFDPSPPCRMVRLCAEALGLDLEIKNIDLGKGENLEPEFVQINPQHTIPTLVDDGLVITESRAILMYLVNKYGDGNESLYPTDPAKRAMVDMRICFELSTLYVRFSETIYPTMFRKLPLDPAKVEKVNEALGHVENFLQESSFIAGSEPTIADFSMSVILSTLDACGHDLSNFPEINNYLQKCAETMKGWDEVNIKGAEIFGGWFKSSLAEIEG